MASESILEQLRDIMLDVFDLDDVQLTPATTADDIEEWDSLSHVRLVVAVERKFGFKLRREFGDPTVTAVLDLATRMIENESTPPL